MAACRMTENVLQHQPVLLAEVIVGLGIKSEGVYVDATFGRGGHAQSILSQLSPTGRLLAMDKDQQAIDYACQFFNDSRFTIQQGSFAGLAEFVKQQGLYGKVDGILCDLGVSSPQLDDPERGFSFMRAGKLDMRMDTSRGMDAATWLASVSAEELARVFYSTGRAW
ncbi:hypothetical protein AYO45_02790 [Gammaproteobacteria bacterium SCGC AG-212-F23]|nr:hypothetical protein AYO45_02790 [Gammaproteobacteria bacterium SCGC AG-212-F23]